MDPLFNKLIPQFKPATHIIHPTGKTFITGLACNYDEHSYDPAFFATTGLDELQYRQLLDIINTTLITYWPCTMCQIIGYCLCPCTLGLSFVVPGMAIAEARTKVGEDIDRINKEVLQGKGLFMVLQVYCSTSWLEIVKMKRTKKGREDVEMEPLARNF
ncbi:hypothetical protein FGO68_gene5705 [Halteria grandinella]|uniref:Golgin subfamily A member 7/ERF4 domain-containing protein n=1 Tax=Halteria grandinella TaxID=5974 RepID=A0A8J8SXR5_HALGN|nr:hypothetical protein FGO68_gene5705 [Halteria grandinella]